MTEHHRWVHDNPETSERAELMVPSHADPEAWPITYRGVRLLLTDAGGFAEVAA